MYNGMYCFVVSPQKGVLVTCAVNG